MCLCVYILSMCGTCVCLMCVYKCIYACVYVIHVCVLCMCVCGVCECVFVCLLICGQTFVVLVHVAFIV